MVNFILVTGFVYILSWISVSVSDFHTLEVQPGGGVTLECANFTKMPTHIHWFKLGSKPNVSCISSMLTSDANTTFCEGFQNGRFSMTSNTSTVSLKIKQVDLSDTGLYVCGSKSDGNPVVVHATYLKVTQEMFAESPKLIVILAGVIIFLLLVIVGLMVKLRKYHSDITSGSLVQQLASDQGQNPQHTETLGSDAVNYSALSFKPKPKTNHRPASERQLETDVGYSATR